MISENTQLLEIFVTIFIGVISAIILSGILIIVVVYRQRKALQKRNLEHEEMMLRNTKVFKECDAENLQEDSMEDIVDAQESDSSYYNESRMLDDDQWMDDVTRLVPFCLAILKNCRSLTERITALAMGALNSSGDGLSKIVMSARCISKKVDDLVLCMYPPIDVRLLEARSSGLILAVTQLAMVTQYECQNTNIPMEWIESALNELQLHLKILRDAAYYADKQKSVSLLSTASSEETRNVHSYVTTDVYQIRN